MDEKKKKKLRLRWGMQAEATGATGGASLHLETEESLDKSGSSIFWYSILRGYRKTEKTLILLCLATLATLATLDGVKPGPSDRAR